MSFQLDVTNIPRFETYSSARAYWETRRPWRGKTGRHDERPLDKNRNKKHVSIRMGNNDQISCRLHGTDVVTFYPDGSIGLQPYHSISTDNFARRLTPLGIDVVFNSTPQCVMLYDLSQPGLQRLYKLAKTPADGNDPEFIIEPHDPSDPAHPLVWKLRDSHTMPFLYPRVDRKKANAASKATGLKDFITWFKALRAMGGVPEPFTEYYYKCDYRDYSRREMVEILADPDKWRLISHNRYYIYSSVASLEVKLRQAVYEHHNCYTYERLDYLTSLTHLRNYQSAVSKTQRN
jgi:hypothetical protein